MATVFFLSVDSLHVARWQKVQVVWQQQRQQPRGSRQFGLCWDWRGFSAYVVVQGISRPMFLRKKMVVFKSLDSTKIPARPEGFEKTNWPEGASQTGNSQKHMAQTLAAGKFNDTSPLWAEGLWLRGRWAILGYGLQFSGNAHMFGKRDGPLLKTNPKVCKTRRLAKVV